MSTEKKAIKEKEVSPLDDEYGLIIWTDGGANPTNPGPAGWGMHGYYFRAMKPKRGSGCPDQILTTQGYVPKVEHVKLEVPEMSVPLWEKVLKGKAQPVEVTPIHYLDGYGAFTTFASNNAAELRGAVRALEYALEFPVKLVQILTDSQYVRDGIEKWVHGWAKSNWLRYDRQSGISTPVKNAELWKELIARREQLEARGAKVMFAWVRGHSDHLGNQRADRLATVATLVARQYLAEPQNGQALSCVVNSPAEGYWKYETEKHPFISHRFMYFNTSPEYVKTGEYYLGNQGKEERLIGTRSSDGGFAIVLLKEVDPVLEMIRTRQMELAAGTNTIVLGHLDEAYTADTHRELVNYGATAAIRENPYKPLDLNSLAKRPLTRELDPARLAMRVVDSMGDMRTVLDSYLAKDPRLAVTDLNPLLYETTVKTRPAKKGESAPEPIVSMQLKEQYNTGFASLEVQAAYPAPDGVKTAPVILVLGMDLVDRNTLKRLETRNPKISLVTWMESEKVFRFATVIEAGEDLGIWAGWYSNTRFLTP